MTTQFFSCDWGTSTFRLTLVDNSGAVAHSDAPHEGVSEIYRRWQGSGDPDRFSFFRNVLAAHIRAIENDRGESFTGVPVVVSGMASSAIGMKELPYKMAPFLINGSDLEVERIAGDSEFDHPLLLISGVRAGNEVMRGEETQIVGTGDRSNTRIILPGTHSKHVDVHDGMARTIATYMTGELFGLLSTKSILSNSVRKGKFSADSFTEGVTRAAQGNLLNSAFTVRTNRLFNILTEEQNYSYFSGLTIGTELCDLQSQNINEILIVGSDDLNALYEKALAVISPGVAVSSITAQTAIINGHRIVFELNRQLL